MDRLRTLPFKEEPSPDIRRPTLDLALLRTFVAIVDSGTMARAAERVARSQPAVSLQMKKLDEVIGSDLLRRHGRRLMPTEIGETLYAYAKRLLEINDEAMSALSSTGLAGTIRLGIAQDFAEGYLTTVLARFARAHPSVIVEVRADRNAVLLDLLERRQLDIALILGDARDGSGNDNGILIGQLPMAWIGLTDTCVDDGRSLPLVLFEAPCIFRKTGLAALDKAGMPWRVAFSSPSLSSQWSAVAAGLGVTVRTPLGIRAPLTILGPEHGLPVLPAVDISLYCADEQPGPLAQKLQAILIDSILTAAVPVRPAPS